MFFLFCSSSFLGRNCTPEFGTLLPKYWKRYHWITGGLSHFSCDADTCFSPSAAVKQGWCGADPKVCRIWMLYGGDVALLPDGMRCTGIALPLVGLSWIFQFLWCRYARRFSSTVRMDFTLACPSWSCIVRKTRCAAIHRFDSPDRFLKWFYLMW